MWRTVRTLFQCSQNCLHSSNLDYHFIILEQLFPTFIFVLWVFIHVLLFLLVDGEEVETETTGRLGVVRYPEAQSALSSIMHQSSPNLNGPGDYGSNG